MSMLYFSISWTRKACVASCLADLTFQHPTFILDFACLMTVVGFPRFMAFKKIFRLRRHIQSRVACQERRSMVG